MRAFINIDYTYDFVADAGALTCGVPGQRIEGKIVELTKEFIQNGDYVVFAIDVHDKEMSITRKRSYSRRII